MQDASLQGLINFGAQKIFVQSGPRTLWFFFIKDPWYNFFRHKNSHLRRSSFITSYLNKCSRFRAGITISIIIFEDLQVWSRIIYLTQLDTCKLSLKAYKAIVSFFVFYCQNIAVLSVSLVTGILANSIGHVDCNFGPVFGHVDQLN